MDLHAIAPNDQIRVVPVDVLKAQIIDVECPGLAYLERGENGYRLRRILHAVFNIGSFPVPSSTTCQGNSRNRESLVGKFSFEDPFDRQCEASREQDDNRREVQRDGGHR